MKKALIGIVAIISIALLAFYGDDTIGEPTGLAAFGGAEEGGTTVLLKGLSFDAVISGRSYYYLFSEDIWYESEDLISWQPREEMGSSLWSGLYYLRSYDATIYHKQKQLIDISEFAQAMRSEINS